MTNNNRDLKGYTITYIYIYIIIGIHLGYDELDHDPKSCRHRDDLSFFGGRVIFLGSVINYNRVYTCMDVDIYIFIHVERGRERDTHRYIKQCGKPNGKHNNKPVPIYNFCLTTGY